MNLLYTAHQYATFFGLLAVGLSFAGAILWQLWPRRKKPAPPVYLMRRLIEYRGKTIELSVTEYESDSDGRWFGVPLYRVAWSACDNGSYTLASAENIGSVIKEWYKAAQKHVDDVLATPDQLAKVKDLLDNLEL